MTLRMNCRAVDEPPIIPSELHLVSVNRESGSKSHACLEVGGFGLEFLAVDLSNVPFGTSAKVGPDSPKSPVLFHMHNEFAYSSMNGGELT
jgi:hypothetical protein